MPGTPLNLDLPSLADPLSTIVSKLTTALSVVEDDLEPKIVPSEININAALSMNGAALTNTGSVQLVAGNAPTAAGSIYYNTDGEFYAIDATSAVRITLNGALDASSFGGITGMGGTNAAVTYNLAQTNFTFSSDTGVYADLVARYLTLEGSAGNTKFGTASAVTTSQQFLINTMPTGGVVPLFYDSATSSVVDGSVVQATASPLFTDISLTGNAFVGGELQATEVVATSYLSTSGGFRHPEWIRALPTFGGSLEGSGSQTHNQVTVNSGSVWYQIIPVRANERVKKVEMNTSLSGGSGSPLAKIVKMSSGGLLTIVQSAAFTGSSTYTLTVGSPVDAGSFETWFLVIDTGTYTGNLFVTCPMVYIDAVTG